MMFDVWIGGSFFAAALVVNVVCVLFYAACMLVCCIFMILLPCSLLVFLSVTILILAHSTHHAFQPQHRLHTRWTPRRRRRISTTTAPLQLPLSIPSITTTTKPWLPLSLLRLPGLMLEASSSQQQHQQLNVSHDGTISIVVSTEEVEKDSEQDDDILVAATNTFQDEPEIDIDTIEEEEDEEDENENDDDVDDDPHFLPLFAHHDQEWLQEATDQFFDHEIYPLGQLTESDVEMITSLMAAWARCRSSHAAVTVERLLQRVVEDLRYSSSQSNGKTARENNTDENVESNIDERARSQMMHTRMYIHAMEAWAKSTVKGGHLRAMQIHDALVQQHAATRNACIAPTLDSFNTLLKCLARSGDYENAPRLCEQVLQSMIATLHPGEQEEGEQEDEPRDDNQQLFLRIKPDDTSFAYILDAYARSAAAAAITTFSPTSSSSSLLRRDYTERCRQLFALMDELHVSKTVYTYSALQYVYARSGRSDAPQQCMDILQEMLDSCSSSSSSSSSTTGGAPLQHAQYLHQHGDVVKPIVMNFNAVLNAASRNPNMTHAKMASDLLEHMELPVEQGGYDVEPDRLSYALTILACTRAAAVSASEESSLEGVWLAEQNLEKMEARARLEEAKRLEISSAAPASVRLDVECFNVVLTAMSRSTRIMPDATTRMWRIIQRMEQYAGFNQTINNAFSNNNINSNNTWMTTTEAGNATRLETGMEVVRPNVRSYNALLNAMARASGSIDQDNSEKNNMTNSDDIDDCLARQAEQVLQRMFQLHHQGIPGVLPDVFSFAAVLMAYQRASSSNPQAAIRADGLVRYMEELYVARTIPAPPDVYHYTILCGTWAKSSSLHYYSNSKTSTSTLVKGRRAAYKNNRASERCVQILVHMMKRHQEGYPNVKPNVRTFNAVLDCLARTGQGERAEQLLYYMLNLYSKQGDRSARPDSFSFNSVIRAFSRDGIVKGSGRRAEAVLDRFLEYYDEEMSKTSTADNKNSNMTLSSSSTYTVRPDLRSFTNIIAFYEKSKELDAPYRAEYVLNRLISLFKDGQKHLAPTQFAIASVMDSYSATKHPDAGRNAERLLRLAHDLNDKYGAKIPVNTSLMNRVLYAWANCGDTDAGRAAQMNLDLMEEQCEQGAIGMCPNSRTYRLVLSAWSRSMNSDKAQRALGIIERIKEQQRSGKRGVSLDEHHYTIAINTCAFVDAGAEAESEAFRIAVNLFDEITASDELHPTSSTYGWFIQCGQLGVPEGVKTAHIERAFLRCCEDGLVDLFVFNRLKSVVSDSVFTRLVTKGRNSRGRYSFANLPAEWTKNLSPWAPRKNQ
jgi:pentatricopeptide repeat protein